MNITKNLGMLALGIWLLLVGLLPFVSALSGLEAVVMPILALVAGVLILIGR